MKLASYGLVGSVMAMAALTSCGDDGGSGDDPVEAGVDDDVPAGDDDTPGDDDEDDDVTDDDDEPADDDITEDDDDPTDLDGGFPDPHAVPDASTGGYQCALLGSSCHAFDTGAGDLGDQCHDIGHAGDPEACAEVFDECMAFCSADGGLHEPGDGGAHHEPDGGAHHEPDGGSSVCEELGQLCHDLDTGDAGLATECHEVGHAGDEVACSAIYDDCVVLCGPDQEPFAGPPLCPELGQLCHDLDTGDAGLATECHEVGHAGDEAACAVIYAECVELCAPTGDAG